MAQCECGCGQESEREFLPGHDQKLRTQLESRAGSLFPYPRRLHPVGQFRTTRSDRFAACSPARRQRMFKDAPALREALRQCGQAQACRTP